MARRGSGLLLSLPSTQEPHANETAPSLAVVVSPVADSFAAAMRGTSLARGVAISLEVGRLNLHAPEGSQEIPSWARFMAAIGGDAVDLLREGRLVRAFIIAPTRRMVAPFIAAEICLRRAAEGQEQTEWWLDAQPGQAVRVVGNRVFTGIFEAVEQRGDRSYLRLMTEGPSRTSPDGTHELVPVDRSSRVVPVDGEVARLPMNQKGRALSGAAGVVRDLMGDISSSYLASSADSTVLVGQSSSLRSDMESIMLMSDSPAVTNVADLVRVKEFGNGRSYRARWFSSRAVPDLDDEAVVIFNGTTEFASGVFEHHHRPWIAVAERSSPSLDIAVQTLDSLYSSSGAHRIQVATGQEAPAGVELLAYAEDA